MESTLSPKRAVVTERSSPVYALLRKPSMIDFPGRLCRVLFISGCNLRCIFCHNYELIEYKETTLNWQRLLEVLRASRENWVDAVCISGGEPTLHPHLKELILRVKDLGFHVKLDTNGTRPEVLEELMPLLDYVAMDYKAPRERYPEIACCESQVSEKIAESAKLIINHLHDYEFRTTVFEPFHQEEDILSICRELEGAKRYVLQAYVPPRGVEPDRLPSSIRTPMTTLKKYHKLCQGHFKEAILRGA